MLLKFLLYSSGTKNFIPAEQLRQRVASHIKTTFASRYTREVSLAEMLQPEAIASYAKQATGEKYLVCPQRAAFVNRGHVGAQRLREKQQHDYIETQLQPTGSIHSKISGLNSATMR